MSRCKQACAAAALVVLVCATAAGAATSGTSTVPDMSKLVLTAGDVPASHIAFHGLLPGQQLPTYAVTFMPKTAGRPIVQSMVIMFPDAAHGAASLTGIYALGGTPEGRQLLANAAKASMLELVSSPGGRVAFRAPTTFKVLKVTVGNPTKPANDVVVLPHTVVTSLTTAHMTVAYVQEDRAVGAVAVVQMRGAIPSHVLAPLIAATRARLKAGFHVVSVSPPAIGGTAAQGQTLSADNGNWSGGATDYTYAWERCAADGSACTPVDGATTSTYAVSSADAGFTLRVVVTGANAVSNAAATSLQTAVVS